MNKKVDLKTIICILGIFIGIILLFSGDTYDIIIGILLIVLMASYLKSFKNDKKIDNPKKVILDIAEMAKKRDYVCDLFVNNSEGTLNINDASIDKIEKVLNYNGVLSTLNAFEQDRLKNEAFSYKLLIKSSNDKITILVKNKGVDIKYNIESDNFNLLNDISSYANDLEFCNISKIDAKLVKEKEVEKEIVTEKVNYNKEELVEKIKEATKKVAYHINTEEITDGDIFISKFGGLGYWDKNKEYPLDNEGNQLVLLAQINFDKDKFDNDLLPKSGLLQFYIADDNLYGFDTDSFKVIYHEKVNYDVTREDLSDIKTNIGNKEFPFSKEFKISFEKFEDYLGPCSEEFKDIVKDLTGFDGPLYQKFGDDVMSYLYDKLDNSGSKLLGYPIFTQEDPRIPGDEKYATLLFPMDSKGDIMWGDLGVANFFINEKDLKNKDFEKVLYTWDCG